jgi:malonyl-CoA O-methyltransferase
VPQRFDEAAVVHREVRTRALERLLLLRQTPSVILDLGAGTGHGSAWLNSQFPRAQVVAIDSAFGMLLESNRQRGSWRRLLGRSFSRACGDASTLPLRSASIDWVVSNLMLSWCSSIEAVFAEVRRVLKPGGVFAFTSFGPDTLCELRQAWRRVDTHEHVHPFIDMHDLGDALIHAGFSEPVLDVERIRLTYADIKSLLAELKASGSCNALPGRARGLTTQTQLAKMATAYESLRNDGKLPTTYEVVYGQAWQSPVNLRTGSQKTLGGETKIPVTSVRIRGRRP